MGIFDFKHWIVILLVVVLVFGTKKMKNLGADVGETIKGFRKAMSDEGGTSSVETHEGQGVETKPVVADVSRQQR
uniref:twin-arginine translocase TatA/TatE family subunit n=1 Tax=Pseudomonas bambusae TaxID=3139142 RepID=UPI004038E9B3